MRSNRDFQNRRVSTTAQRDVEVVEDCLEGCLSEFGDEDMSLHEVCHFVLNMFWTSEL